MARRGRKPGQQPPRVYKDKRLDQQLKIMITDDQRKFLYEYTESTGGTVAAEVRKYIDDMMEKYKPYEATPNLRK